MTWPGSYAMAAGFLGLMGFLFFLVLERFLHISQNTPLFEGFFDLFWLPVLFGVPLLTLRSFSQERREGILESVLATGASLQALVWSKFLALFSFYCLLWLLCLSFPLWMLGVLGQAAHNHLDVGMFVGSYAFIALSGAFYLSVGMLLSSFTENATLAGMLTFCVLFILIVGSQLLPQSHLLPDWLQAPLLVLQNLPQLEDLRHGILDSRPVVFYGSGTLLCLTLCRGH